MSALQTRRIVVAVPPEGAHRLVLQTARQLTVGVDAVVEFVSVLDVAETVDPHTQLARPSRSALAREGKVVKERLMEQAGTVFAPTITVMVSLLAGAPVDALLAHVHAEPPDFLVMATRGHSGLRRALMGSVAEGVTRRAPCPVVVVPPERER